MPRYNYRAKGIKGEVQNGIVEAGSLRQATSLLHERGFYIINIKELTPKFSLQIGHNKISFDELVHFTRQLSTMITAGLTLVDSLAIIKQQLTKPATLKLVTQIEDEVEGGKSFADVLKKYPETFPPIYIALVKAGEASGKLDTILDRLAENLEKSRDFRNKIRGVLIYPAIVVTGMMTVSLIVMTVVVPRLTQMYKEFGVTLPLPTQILIAVSTFLINYWFIMVGSFVVIFLIFMRWKETWTGKHVLAGVSLRIPIFGALIKQSTLVEITRTLAMLIDGGVPILLSLEISRDATSNILYKEAFTQAAKKVEKGFPLSEPLSDTSLFPPILPQMVVVGEQTGKLGDSLFKLSRYFETEAETAIRALTTMIEPLIMVVLGLGVGFLVMAVLLPIYSLTSKF